MNNYHLVIQALLELAPNKEWTFADEDLSTLSWGQDYEDAPSIEQIIAKAEELQGE
jgi:hypothetical protein